MDSAILALAFGLGMLHALDADHIAAVANLAGHGPSRRHALLAGGLWALGHGLSLLLLGAAVLLLGMAIPERFTALAEHLIALVLIGIGLWVLWDLYRRRVHLHFHSHDGLLQHGHLHAHPGTAPTTGLICGASTRGAFTTIGTTGVIRTRTTMARSWSAGCTAWPARRRSWP